MKKASPAWSPREPAGEFFFLPTPHPLGRVDVRKKKRKGRTESEHIILIRQIENNGES